MESKFFPSSADQAKRRLSNDPQESPTLKRAKRARRNKKHHSNGERDSYGYVKQSDWISDHVSETSTPGTNSLKPAEKTEKVPQSEPKREDMKTAGDTEGDVNVDGAAGAKTEANVRKARGSTEISTGSSEPINKTAYIPATAGSSKPSATKNLNQAKQPTPHLTPRPDYTFKAYPNPPAIQFPFYQKREVPKELNGPQEARAKHLASAPIIKSPGRGISNGGAKGQKEIIMPKSPTPNKTNGATPKEKLEGTTKSATKDTANGATKEHTAETANDTPSSPIPASLYSAPAGTKTLKAINKHLKALTTSLAAPPQPQNPSALAPLHAALTAIQTRLEADALRAAVRHEIVFSALLKIAASLSSSTAAIPDDNTTSAGPDTPGQGTGTPRAGGKEKEKEAVRTEARARQMLQARKTLEQCLRIYSEDMERAASREEVERCAVLVVKYAGDLFKTMG